MRRGAKRTVVWICGLGIVALIGATVLSWDTLTERYWLWKLEAGDAATALAAAQELSRRRSLRAVGPLVERILATPTEAADGWESPSRSWLGLRPIEPDVAKYKEVYLPPFALCLHGVGPPAAAVLEREITTLEREASELPARGGTAADRAQDQAVARTLHALRCVRQAWRDPKLTVQSEVPVQVMIID